MPFVPRSRRHPQRQKQIPGRSGALRASDSLGMTARDDLRGDGGVAGGDEDVPFAAGLLDGAGKGCCARPFFRRHREGDIASGPGKTGPPSQRAAPGFCGLLWEAAVDALRNVTKHPQRGDCGLPVCFFHTSNPPVRVISECDVLSPHTDAAGYCNWSASRGSVNIQKTGELAAECEPFFGAVAARLPFRCKAMPSAAALANGKKLSRRAGPGESAGTTCNAGNVKCKNRPLPAAGRPCRSGALAHRNSLRITARDASATECAGSGFPSRGLAGRDENGAATGAKRRRRHCRRRRGRTACRRLRR